MITNARNFYREVNQEAKKINWPTRKEVISHSIVVIVMAIMFAIFFVAIDVVVMNVVKYILGI